MIDYYLCGSEKDVLAQFVSGFENVIGPVSGLSCGEEEPEEAAAPSADPQAWYACLRTDAPVVLPEGIAIVDLALGRRIVGVWAD